MSWQYCALGSLVEIKGGGTPARNEDSYWNGAIPWATVKDFKSSILLETEEYVTELGVKKSATNIIPAGTIIIPTRMALGKVAIAGRDVAINQDLKALQITDERIAKEFLFWFLRSSAESFERAGKGATVKGITVDFLKTVQVPLPPLGTQKHIARVLEQADQLRKQAQQMESELNQLAQSLFLEMFGDPSSSKNTKTEPLGNHIEFLTSGSRGWAEYYSESGALFIRSLDVQMNNLEIKDAAYVNPPENAEGRRTKVEPGDVLLTITGSRIGRVCEVPSTIGDAYISQHVALIRLKASLNPTFLTTFLSLPLGGQVQIARSQYGQTKPGLNLEQIRNFQIPSASPAQQKSFAKIYKKWETEKNANAQRIQCVDELFNSLMQRAFKGELTPKANRPVGRVSVA